MPHDEIAASNSPRNEISMDPITQSDVKKMCAQRRALCHPLLFLDEFKIALHLEPIAKRLPAEVDFSQTISLEALETIDLSRSSIERDSFYLGFSRELFSLPPNIIGLMHTRSTLARIGLDFFGSSIYVSPGFGSEKPTRMVFEINSRVTIKNLPLQEPVAGLVLYQISENSDVWRGKGRHANRFPFVDHRPVTWP